ncbi:fasciclin-like arabinogalactan protein 21 [Rhododendron vialii]|uniref:fasciclin-like arabinogalactan protein 21 n=1 Tax=Rhododendron vialii TaxID=182163 RepID=UPI00265DF174|nr:fasciclin-like arabinogalactan protein 21 [Rhododendron vialii]
MATPLQLLPTLAFLLISTTASILPPSPSSYQGQTHPLLLLGPVLSSLGFRKFAAPSLSNSTVWLGPITIFATSDSSLLTCGPSCSLPLLLQEHTVPSLFSLRSLPFATKIETLAPDRCLTVTSSLHNTSKVFVGGVEITHPNLFDDGLVVVHGLQGFVSHLSLFSCNIERTPSLSFPPPPQDASFIMCLMLKDAMLRLWLSGYSIVAIALRVKYPYLVDLKSVTVFALNDAAIFSNGGHEYVTSFRFHIIPDRLLMTSDLERLPAGTVLPTLNLGQELVVTTGGGGVPFGGPVRINYVRIERPDLMFNLKMVVHGLSMPFPNVNLMAVIGSGQIGRSGYTAAGWGVPRNAEVGNKMTPQSRIEWTDEIEDHHGL